MSVVEPSSASLAADEAAFAQAQAQGEADTQLRQAQAQGFQDAEAPGDVDAGEL